jgi:hypothetical protein
MLRSIAHQTLMLNSEPWLDFAPEADGWLVVSGVPVVVTDWTTPWAFVTVVVMVPSELVTDDVVVPVEPPPELEPDPLGAGEGDAVETGVGLAPTPPIALTPLMTTPLVGRDHNRSGRIMNS